MIPESLAWVPVLRPWVSSWEWPVNFLHLLMRSWVSAELIPVVGLTESTEAHFSGWISRNRKAHFPQILFGPRVCWGPFPSVQPPRTDSPRCLSCSQPCSSRDSVSEDPWLPWAPVWNVCLPVLTSLFPWRLLQPMNTDPALFSKQRCPPSLPPWTSVALSKFPFNLLFSDFLYPLYAGFHL